MQVDDSQFLILRCRQCFDPRLLRSDSEWLVCKLTWRHYRQTALDSTGRLCFPVTHNTLSHGTGTLKGNSDLQTLICVVVARPRRCLTSSNTVPWQNWMAAYLGYTRWRAMRVRVHFKHLLSSKQVSQEVTNFFIKILKKQNAESAYSFQV